MTDFVDIFDELINEQNDKIKYVLIGIGHITIKQDYKHVFIDPSSIIPEQRQFFLC